MFIEEKVSIFDRQRLEREASFFFKGDKPQFKRTDLLYAVNDINDSRVNDYLSGVDDTLICVFGCSIIKMENAFTKNTRMVNLHSGITPKYRGVHCVFWALYNEEPDMVGCTIHFVNQRIDEGNIISQASPDISPDDDEETLFNKTIKLGTTEFIRAIKYVYENGRCQSIPQAGAGKVYFSRERTENEERKLRSILAKGLLRRCCLPERVKRFYESD
jgi:methionyl-tRNA formyltransferase